MLEEFENDIHAKELDLTVTKYGSFVGMLLNKNISCVTLFSYLLKDKELKNLLVGISDRDWFDVVKHMSYRYPILCKSKKIKKNDDE